MIFEDYHVVKRQHETTKYVRDEFDRLTFGDHEFWQPVASS